MCQLPQSLLITTQKAQPDKRCVQLASQGHSFTMLLSSQEVASRQILERRLSANMKILTYSGDSNFVPLRDWVAAEDPLAARDGTKVH